MDSFLLIFNIVLAILLLVGVMFMIRATLELRKAVKQIDDRVNLLDKRLMDQQRQVNELRVSLSSQPDPLQSIIGHLGGWKQQGPMKTLVALGTSLFGAYFKQKRTKALPASVESKGRELK